MPYFVKSCTNNGYRCSCCHESWEEVTQVDDRTVALAEVPTQYERERERVEVVDGTTGKVIAEGRLVWTGGKSIRYSHYHWFGHVDGVPFDDIHGLREGESTWEDVCKRVAREADEQKLKQLETEAAAKQKEIDALKARLR